MLLLSLIVQCHKNINIKYTSFKQTVQVQTHNYIITQHSRIVTFIILWIIGTGSQVMHSFSHTHPWILYTYLQHKNASELKTYKKIPIQLWPHGIGNNTCLKFNVFWWHIHNSSLHTKIKIIRRHFMLH